MLWSLWVCSIPYQTSNLTDAASVHLHFEHTELVDMLLGYATYSIVHWVNVGAVWSGDMNCGFYSRSTFTSVITCAIGSVINPSPQLVLRCLIVTLSNIVSLLIYPTAFVLFCIPRADRVTENIISRNGIPAQISTVNRRLQNILRMCVRNITFLVPTSIRRTFVRCHTFVLQVSVTATLNWKPHDPNFSSLLTIHSHHRRQTTYHDNSRTLD